MTKIRSKCVSSMLLGMIILMSLIILPQQLIKAQTLQSILDERIRFKMNPQIKLGSGLLSSMAVNSLTNKIYVTNKDSNTISVIDSNSGNITNGIRVGIEPTFIAINEVQNKIYVLNSGSGTVSVIDGYNDKKMQNDIPVGKTDSHSAIALDQDLNKIYVGNSYGSWDRNDTVSVINGTTDKKYTDIPVGKGPYAIASNAERGPFVLSSNAGRQSKIYVANSDTNTVSVINGTTDKKYTDIPVGKGPKAIAKGLGYIFVANEYNDSVSVINTDDDKSYIDIPLGAVPVAIASDAEGVSKIYVATTNDTVFVTKPAIENGEIKYTDIPVGKGPVAINYDVTTNKVYVANIENDTVSVINGTTDKKYTDIPVGKGPKAIAVNSMKGITYVLNSDTISAINNLNDKVSAGVTFNVSPENSGTIVCNNKEYPTNTYLYVEAGIKCIATPNKDFEFSSWVENLGHNSTIPLSTSSISDSPVNSFLRFLNITQNDTSATFVVDRYGSFTANFRHSPPAIPAEYWIPLYGVIVSSIVGWSIPSIIGWIKARRQGRKANQYYKKINRLYDDGKLDENDIADLDRLKTDLTYSYAKGKISEQHYANLKSEISILYEEIYKKKIDSLDGKNINGLDKVKNDIKDAYAKGKISEQHYNLLNEKISDSKNNKESTNKVATSPSSGSLIGSPIKN